MWKLCVLTEEEQKVLYLTQRSNKDKSSVFLVIKIAIQISQIVYFFLLFARNSLIATFLRNKLSFTYFWRDKFCFSCGKVYLSFSAYEIICKRHITSVHSVSYIILCSLIEIEPSL